MSVPVFTKAEGTPLPISPGCRASTQADQAARRARGIPEIYQVCPGDETALGIGENFDTWYAQLKKVQKCASNKCGFSCIVRNTGAQVCGPTSRRWNSIGCHPNNNTAIFPSASYGFAAHIELLRRYCGERKRCTIADVVNLWTATVGDRPAYASFVSANSGMPANKVFDPNDVDLMGRIALSMSCFESGSMPYSVSDLKEGLKMAAGGPRVAVPSNVGELLAQSLNGSYPANPSGIQNSFPSSWGYPASSINGNNNYMPAAAGASYSQGTSGGSATAGTIDVRGTSAGTGPSAEKIVVQPKDIARGAVLMVSWTSVNMVKDTCLVYFDNQEFARGSEGFKVFKTVSSDNGVLAFTLKCQDAAGQQYTSSASSTIQ